MNERFVAVSTVTGSRICGCCSKLRRDFSVTRGGNRSWMQLDGLSNLRKKITTKFVAPIWKRRKLRILQRQPVWHRRCHWINNANSSPLDRLNRFCLILPQAVMPNNRAVFKNWSDDGGIPNSKSVSRKTSTLKPFETNSLPHFNHWYNRPENLSNSVKKTQNKGYYGIQGHSRSSTSVPIESLYAISY